MLTIHHLSNSRSEKIIWLMEELEEEYQLKIYLRDPETLQAPPEMKKLHPLGKSPLITDNGETYAETGAIMEYILRHYGHGRLQPDPASTAFDRHIEWMHFSEGSGMFPILLNIFCSYAKGDVSVLTSLADQQLKRHLDFIELTLEKHPYLVGDEFTAADIHVSFVAQTAKQYMSLENYPHTLAWLERLHARPAFTRAEQKGGYFGAAKPGS